MEASCGPGAEGGRPGTSRAWTQPPSPPIINSQLTEKGWSHSWLLHPTAIAAWPVPIPCKEPGPAQGQFKSPVAKVRVSLLESDPVSSLDSARGAFYLDTHAHTSARVHTHARTHSAARCQPPGASTSSLLTHTIRAPGTRFSTSPPSVLKTRRVASSAIGVRFMSMGDRFHRRGWGGLE